MSRVTPIRGTTYWWKMSEPSELFEILIQVEPADIDELGHVNNVCYARWVQEAAVAHWKYAASEADQAKLLWVVLRHEIDYKQAAYLGDDITVETWVGNASHIKFERHTEIRRNGDGQLLAKAKSIWCPIDAHTGRPARVSAEVRAHFSAEPG